jgi:hypothetical protein
MPVFRKLTPDEVVKVTGIGVRKITELEYDGYLQGFAPGDYGEALLGADEKRVTIMNRLKAAAKRCNPPLALHFRRTGDETHVRFKVAAADYSIAEVLEAPIGSDTPPTRGVRLRKRAAE